MHNLKKRFLACFLSCLSVILLSSSQTWADTYVSGVITSDTTWTKANSPYIVTSNLMIMENVTLTIEPGVTIKFNKSTGLKNNGRLIAMGTEENMIIFTSNQETPNLNDWIGIQFDSDAIGANIDEKGNYLDGSILDFCSIEYAESIQNIYENISLYISNCFIEGGGIYTTGEKSKIFNNIINGYVTASGDNFIVSYNEINGCFAVLGDNTTILNNYIRNCGIDYRGSNAQIINNTISNNEGSGIYCNQWNGYNQDANAVILNNIIENNGGGIYIPMAHNGGKNIVIQYNLIQNNAGDGISNAGDNITILNNTITDNGSGISHYANNLTCTQNNIYDNGDYDFANYSTEEINANNNYWGTINTSLIDDHIYDFNDSFSSGIVHYQSIATNAFKIVDFTASPLYGSFPLSVIFTNESMGVITSAIWDFGDGETSNEINPVHVYKSAGTFNVTLTVVGRNGEITEIKSNYITVVTPNYTLSLSKSGNGSVKVDGTTHTLPWSGQFPSGTNVQIEAVPDTGWSFINLVR